VAALDSWHQSLAWSIVPRILTVTDGNLSPVMEAREGFLVAPMYWNGLFGIRETVTAVPGVTKTEGPCFHMRASGSSRTRTCPVSGWRFCVYTGSEIWCSGRLRQPDGAPCTSRLSRR
jgi:hypothetical protein